MDSRSVFKQQTLDPNNNNGGRFENRNLIPSKPLESQIVNVWPKKNKITDFFQVSRVPQKQQKLEQQEVLYIPTDMVTPEELMKNGGRATITVNERQVALVQHKEQIYAMEPKCPHVGGPLHLGDIEDIPGCGPCIKCPWHSWTFSLTTGRCIRPQTRESEKILETFPVQVDPIGKQIKVGFTEISPKVFNSLPE